MWTSKGEAHDEKSEAVEKSDALHSKITWNCATAIRWFKIDFDVMIDLVGSWKRKEWVLWKILLRQKPWCNGGTESRSRRWFIEFDSEKLNYWSCVGLHFGIDHPNSSNVVWTTIPCGAITAPLMLCVLGGWKGNWKPFLISLVTHSIKLVVCIWLICDCHTS